jgi:hypothetical protein
MGGETMAHDLELGYTIKVDTTQATPELSAVDQGFKNVAASAEQADASLKNVGKDSGSAKDQLSDLTGRLSTASQQAGALKSTLDQQSASLKASALQSDALTFSLTKLVGAAVVGVGSISALAVQSIRWASSITDASAKTGASIENLQALNVVLQRSGVSFDSMTTMLIRMSQHLAGGDKNVVADVAELGLELSDLTAMAPDQAFIKLGQAIAGIENPMERSRLAFQLLGRDGAKALAGVSADLGTLVDTAKQSGLVISEQTVKAMDDLDDSWQNLKTAGLALIANVLQPMLPLLNSLADAAVRFTGNLSKMIQGTPGYIAQMWSAMKDLPSFANYFTSGAGAYGVNYTGGVVTPPAATGGAGGGGTKGPLVQFGPTEEELFGPGGRAAFLDAQKRALAAWHKAVAEYGELGAVEMRMLQAGIFTATTGIPFFGKGSSLQDIAFKAGMAGLPSTVVGRGPFDNLTGLLPTTTNTDFFGPNSSLFDITTRAGMFGGPSNVEGRGPFSGTQTTESFWSKLLGAGRGIGGERGLAGFGYGLSETVLGTLMGGGSMLKAGGSYIGQSLGSSVEKMFSGDLTKMLGSTLGGIVGGAIPFVGSLLGPLLGKLFGPSKGQIAGQQADAKIGDLQKQLTDTYGSLENVSALGKLVGVDIGSAWGDKNVEGLKHFTQATKDFNAALAETNRQFDAVTANGGVASNKLLATMAAQAQAGGQVGDQARQALGQFLQANVQQVQTGLSSVAGAGLSFTAGGASAVGSSTLALIAQMQSMGVSTDDILKALGPTIQSLQKQFEKLGVSGGAAFKDLNDQIAFLSDTTVAKTIDGINGLTQIAVGLGNVGQLTQDQFKGLTEQIGASYNKMIAEGKDGARALRAIQPDLQKLWELEQKFGFKADDATQAILDQAVASGQVGPQFASDTDKMTAAIDRLIQKFSDLIDKILGIVPAANAASGAINNIPPPPGTGGGTDPSGPIGHGGNNPNQPGTPGNWGPRPPNYPPNLPWPPTGTASTGGYVTPYGVQHLALGGPVGTDTVNAWLTPGELVVDRPTVNAHGGPRALMGALRGGSGGAEIDYVRLAAAIRAGAAASPATVIMQVDGREIARATAPVVPGEVRRLGVRVRT